MKIGNLEVYGYIYRILNKSNGKVYIGQSCNSFSRRYSGGKWWEYTHNEHLKRSIEKYGKDNFCLTTYLDFAFSKEELDIKEKVYINLYNSTHRDFGYNKRDGGNGVLNESSSKKISIKMLGYDIDEYTDDIIEKYTCFNSTIAEIARSYGVNSAVIKRILLKNNIKIKNNSEVNLGFDIDEFKTDIIDMYVNKKCL